MTSAATQKFTVLKLRETHPDERNRRSESATMFRLWSLLSNDASLRDTTTGPRNVL